MISSVCFSENFRQVARADMKSLALHCAGGFHRQRHWRVHKEEATGAWSQCAEECLAHCRDLATLGHQRRSCFFVAIKSRCRGHAERQCKFWLWFFMIFPYSIESSSSFHGLRNTEGYHSAKSSSQRGRRRGLGPKNDQTTSMESKQFFTLCWDNHGLMDQWIQVEAMKEAMHGPPGTARRVSKIFREKWEELRGMYLDISFLRHILSWHVYDELWLWCNYDYDISWHVYYFILMSDDEASVSPTFDLGCATSRRNRN